MKIAGVEIVTAHPGGLRTPVDARPLLFRPITMRGVTARNRIMLGPMSQYLAVDGNLTDWHIVFYGQFAIGGAGIVCSEETAVEPRGRRTHHCAGIYTDAQVRGYRRITDFLKDLGAVPAIQLGHAGRRASSRSPWEGRKPLGAEDAAIGLAPWTTVSASAIPHQPERPPPVALDIGEIKQEIAAWGAAARRAVDAGFEIIEIHGAHGYLINQFLSPLGNRRTDAYGGDRQGRMRFPLELVEAVRAAWPGDKPLFMRLSVLDGRGGIWDMDDTVALAGALKARGVDVIDCSYGGLEGNSSLPIMPRHLPGYMTKYSEHIRREVDIVTAIVGMITEPAQAEAILQAGQADIIAMAREMMVNPYWPLHAAKALGLPDWLNVLPENYAERLYPREAELQRQKESTSDEFPFRRKD
jgi:2,4-dienoyl-CoA reductase-like NADH-dependent reductase (Old Yellow Enzyme family)